MRTERGSGAVVGCYSVHLYCQHPRHHEEQYAWPPNDAVSKSPMEFAGRSETDCLREARKYGWWIGRKYEDWSRAVLCPYHAREVPR
jgi:hypothetical protein